MVERYIAQSKPLTPYENELLTILIEECAEVAQAATKIMRFGRQERYPGGLDNITKLGLEIGDLERMIELTKDAQFVKTRDVVEGQSRKAERLEQYMQHPVKELSNG